MLRKKENIAKKIILVSLSDIFFLWVLCGSVQFLECIFLESSIASFQVALSLWH